MLPHQTPLLLELVLDSALRLTKLVKSLAFLKLIVQELVAVPFPQNFLIVLEKKYKELVMNLVLLLEDLEDVVGLIFQR